MKLSNTLSAHLKSPDVAPADYVRIKHLEFADSLADRRKIYLDTRYWVLFRDVLLGRTQDKDLHALLEFIRSEVSEGRAVCPLSEPIFSEVFTQQDPITLTKTVELIDELSLGACFTEIMNRHHMEAWHFLSKMAFGEDSVFSTNQLVWTRCGYVLGYVTPRFDNMPADIAIATEKAFFDQLWITTLADMHSFLGSCPEWKKGSDVIAEMNQGKIEHENDFGSFKQLFVHELRGLVDCLLPTYRSAWEQMNSKYPGELPLEVNPDDTQPENALASLIIGGFEKNRFKVEFPTIRVHALLHAGFRWDKKRKYKINDLPDLRHAAMAIPYLSLIHISEPTRPY